MRKELTDITLYFGIETQIEKLREEVEEFIEAIQDYENYLDDDEFVGDKQTDCKFKEHIIEELGDVLNVLEGIEGVYEINDELLKAIRYYKAVRTKLRNEVKYYENI